MRIGFLLSHIANGGAAKSLLLLLKALTKKKYDIVVFVKVIKDKQLYEDFKVTASKIVEVDLPLIKAFDWESTSLHARKVLISRNEIKIKFFVDSLYEERINILHINTTQFTYLNKYVKKERDIILISHIRELLSKKLKIAKIVEAEIKQYSDVIIAISPNEAELFINHPKLTIVPNPVEIFNTEVENKNNINNEVSVGMMGSFHPLKKHMLLLKAINYLKNNNKLQNIGFVIVGVNEREPYWRLIAKTLIKKNYYSLLFYSYFDVHNLSSYVQLYPNIRDVDSIYKCLDIYVRPDGYPWGRDIIEAMAKKVPVIANGESDFLIKNGQTGVLISNTNYIKLADAIFDLAHNKTRRAKYAENAYKFISENCSDNLYAQKVEALYLELVQYK